MAAIARTVSTEAERREALHLLAHRRRVASMERSAAAPSAAELAEVFAIFTGGAAALTPASLKLVMETHLGMAPTDEEAAAIMAEVCGGAMTAEQFGASAGPKREFPDSKADVAAALRAMGGAAGVTPARLKAVLETFGSGMAAEEAGKLVAMAGTDKLGKVPVEAFLQSVYN